MNALAQSGLSCRLLVGANADENGGGLSSTRPKAGRWRPVSSGPKPPRPRGVLQNSVFVKGGKAAPSDTEWLSGNSVILCVSALLQLVLGHGIKPAVL